MRNVLILSLVVSNLALFGCQKKAEETAAPPNIASVAVANLNTISAAYNPNSMDSTVAYMGNSDVQIQADPCQGVTDFAVCQANLIREYLRLGKSTVDLLAQLASGIGAALGQVPDGNAGTSDDGKISWNKASSTVWSILARGTGNAPNSYFSVNGSTYTLKFDNSVSLTGPDSGQADAVVTFTDENNWTVDVFYSKTECVATDVGAPSKVQIRMAREAGLWKGKAMLYAPRFEAPGETVTCATASGTHQLAMFTDFVGNDESSKAALYLIPATNNDLSTIGNFDLMDFCTNFAAYCGGMGEPTAMFLASYPNNWCTTGPNIAPTWNSNCPTNAVVSAATFSAATNWIVPDTLRVKTVTLPTGL